MYYHGWGVRKDETEEKKWREMAARGGHAQAQYEMGWIYQHSAGDAQDKAEAAKWYRKAAEQGHGRAQINLGEMYHSADGIPRDLTEAIKWYREAKKQGQYTDDKIAAAEQFAAAEHGDSKSQYLLGEIYYSGKGVSKDETEAVKWLKKAADQGDSTLEDLIAERSKTAAE
jgi:TPR repeat protein